MTTAVVHQLRDALLVLERGPDDSYIILVISRVLEFAKGPPLD